MPADAAPSFLYVDVDLAPGPLTLGGDEAHYLARVCRAKPAERVTITDGRGGRAEAVVVRISPDVVIEVGPIERAIIARSATLFCGAPERGRADWLVEKLAELGVSVFQPVDCERGAWSRGEARLERWRRLAIAALRQSRRCRLMEVREPRELARALETSAEVVRVLADPDGLPAATVAPSSRGGSALLVGPAEGLSAEELRRVREVGYRVISLADARLRTETAAMALASWWAGAGGSGS